MSSNTASFFQREAIPLWFHGDICSFLSVNEPENLSIFFVFFICSTELDELWCNLIYSGCHCSMLVESSTICYYLLVQSDCLAPTNNACQGEGILILGEGTTRVDFLLEKQYFSLQKLLETLHKAKNIPQPNTFFCVCVLLQHLKNTAMQLLFLFHKVLERKGFC